jgi:hypothetical protein
MGVNNGGQNNISGGRPGRHCPGFDAFQNDLVFFGRVNLPAKKHETL